jgi:hypothetical protein
MTSHDPTNLPLDEWIAALDRSDAEIDAGLSVSGEDVQAKLRAALARMQAAQQPKVPRRDALSR